MSEKQITKEEYVAKYIIVILFIIIASILTIFPQLIIMQNRFIHNVLHLPEFSFKQSVIITIIVCIFYTSITNKIKRKGK
jgi:hypothetical protein